MHFCMYSVKFVEVCTYIRSFVVRFVCLGVMGHFANRVAQGSAITTNIPEALEGLMKVMIDLEIFWK